MRVLFVATYSGTSGASHSLISLIKYLRIKGVQPLVLLPNRGPLEDLLIDEGIPYKQIRLFNWVISIDKYNSKKERFKWFIKKIINFLQEIRIFFILKKEKVDLIHINAITASWGFYASRINRVPIIWHIREFLEEDLNKRFWNKNRAFKQLNTSDCVIAISDSVKNKYVKFINQKRLVRIYNGIDTEKYKKLESNIFEREIVILTLAGRITKEKGHEEVLYAIDKLVNSGIDKIKVRFIGSEGDEYFINNITKLIKELALENYVELSGYRPDMHNVWNETDIALVCSKSEAFGRVTVEAMMAGALVIGANKGGTAEIISNKYGLMYEQGNYASLAEKIKYAIKNKEEMIAIAKEGQVFAYKNFTAENNAQNIYNVYKKLL